MLFTGFFAKTSLAENGQSLSVEADYLIQQIAQTEAVFIRNGKEHPPKEAAEHVRKKFEHFLKKNKIETTEDFIRLSATRSLISKKPYTLRFPDGTVQPTGDYLLNLLTEFRNNS